MKKQSVPRQSPRDSLSESHPLRNQLIDTIKQKLEQARRQVLPVVRDGLAENKCESSYIMYVGGSAIFLYRLLVEADASLVDYTNMEDYLQRMDIDCYFLRKNRQGQNPYVSFEPKEVAAFPVIVAKLNEKFPMASKMMEAQDDDSSSESMQPKTDWNTFFNFKIAPDNQSEIDISFVAQLQQITNYNFFLRADHDDWLLNLKWIESEEEDKEEFEEKKQHINQFVHGSVLKLFELRPYLLLMLNRQQHPPYFVASFSRKIAYCIKSLALPMIILKKPRLDVETLICVHLYFWISFSNPGYMRSFGRKYSNFLEKWHEISKKDQHNLELKGGFEEIYFQYHQSIVNQLLVADGGAELFNKIDAQPYNLFFDLASRLIAERADIKKEFILHSEEKIREILTNDEKINALIKTIESTRINQPLSGNLEKPAMGKKRVIKSRMAMSEKLRNIEKDMSLMRMLMEPLLPFVSSLSHRYEKNVIPIKNLKMKEEEERVKKDLVEQTKKREEQAEREARQRKSEEKLYNRKKREEKAKLLNDTPVPAVKTNSSVLVFNALRRSFTAGNGMQYDSTVTSKFMEEIGLDGETIILLIEKHKQSLNSVPNQQKVTKDYSTVRIDDFGMSVICEYLSALAPQFEHKVLTVDSALQFHIKYSEWAFKNSSYLKMDEPTRATFMQLKISGTAEWARTVGYLYKLSYLTKNRDQIAYELKRDVLFAKWMCTDDIFQSGNQALDKKLENLIGMDLCEVHSYKEKFRKESLNGDYIEYGYVKFINDYYASMDAKGYYAPFNDIVHDLKENCYNVQFLQDYAFKSWIKNDAFSKLTITRFFLSVPIKY